MPRLSGDDAPTRKTAALLAAADTPEEVIEAVRAAQQVVLD